jgi:hypothetical protein
VRPSPSRPPGSTPSHVPVAPTGLPRGGAGRLSTWWHGRYGAALAREAVLVAALLLLYRLGRYLSRDHVASAFDHAQAVLAFERGLGLAVEADVQRLVLAHQWLVSFLNHYYVRAHFPVTVTFLVVAYLRAPFLYGHMRRLFVVVTGLGLAMHVVYPLAPPRMLPGFVDTVARYGPAIYERSDVASVANQYAAMPSMHFAWAVLVAYGVIQGLRSRWRWVAVAHPVLTLFAITATANHYWVDAAVAGLLMAPALVVANQTGPVLSYLRLGAPVPERTTAELPGRA